LDAIEEGEDEEEEQDEDDAVNGEDETMADVSSSAKVEASTKQTDETPRSAPIQAAPQVQTETTTQHNPFAPSTAETTTVYGTTNDIASPPAPKRKNSSPDIVVPAKRQEVGEKGSSRTVPVPEAGDDDSDDESVHLNMEFDDEDGDE
jgi:hypothetical protein